MLKFNNVCTDLGKVVTYHLSKLIMIINEKNRDIYMVLSQEIIEFEKSVKIITDDYEKYEEQWCNLKSMLLVPYKTMLCKEAINELKILEVLMNGGRL